MVRLRDKVVGILGGIGPEATAELFRRVIKATPVQIEQEHLRIIIDNNPQIPDRTLAILGKGESPLKELIKTALNLERAGIEIIAIPCNTAHYYLDDLRKSVHVPVMDMLTETANYIARQFPQMKRLLKPILSFRGRREIDHAINLFFDMQKCPLLRTSLGNIFI